MQPNRNNIRGYQPDELTDLESRSSAEWAAQNRAVDGYSLFNGWPYQEPYLGFGPDNVMLDYSGFGAFPGLDYGWQGAFPVDEQPTIAEVPAYRQGARL